MIVNLLHDFRLWNREELLQYCLDIKKEFHFIGVVITGGEPLIYSQDPEFHELIRDLKYSFEWVSLETSGVFLESPDLSPIEENRIRLNIIHFLLAFDHVAWSPKITRCLKPGIDIDPLMYADIIEYCFRHNHERLNIKIVFHTDRDLKKIIQVKNERRWIEKGLFIYLQPFSEKPDLILEQIKKIIPLCSKEGFFISPRLHTILWKNRRGV